MSDVTLIWNKLEAWIKTNVPDLKKSLKKGASDKQIAKLEKHLGVELPEEYKTFLQLCNGLKDDAEAGFYDGELMSAENVAEQWTIWKNLLDGHHFEDISSKPEKGIRNDWWNPKWIPITHDGGGNHLCIDLEPARDGRPGQIITMWHDSAERELMYASFTDWLEHILTGVESGEIVFDPEDYCALVDKEDVYSDEDDE
jgi:cell wall assembly regulator SMI1